MTGRIRERLTFANVVSIAALFVALGGTAWAISANSVGSKQIKRGAVKKSDLAANAVISEKVADGSLSAADFATGQLPAGERGPQGEQGPQGPQGIQGVDGDQGDPGEAAPGQASPITYSYMDFKPRDTATETGLSTGGMQWVTGTDVVTARLDLPDGAKVTKVDFLGTDNTAGSLSFSVIAYLPGLGATSDLATVTSTGASAGLPRTFTATPGSPPTIDNTANAYELQASTSTGGPNMILYGARVHFTLP